jgi:hypothetical protein
MRFAICSNRFIQVLILISLGLLASCKKDDPAPPTMRLYRMGFQNSAPRFDNFDLFIQSLELWSQRADAAMITTEVPWDSLYAGKSVQEYVINNYQGLVNYYRTKGFKLWIYIDPQNGLNRSSDANALVARGKSIAQDDVQKLYRKFVVAMDSILHPDHLGLALETNLIRAIATTAIYAGVKNASKDAAADVQAIDKNVKLSISVQADFAWGKLLGNGAYIGVAQDYVDFPFIQELGISSYPYFDFSKPEEIPHDYYTKLIDGKSFPVFVTEGGWPSQSFIGPNQKEITSNLILQQNYITHHSKLLDKANAIGVFQLSFTDIDIASLPPAVDPSIRYFSNLGLVDINLQLKPALSVWDDIFKRSLK